MNILGAKSCSSLEFSFELLLFLVPSQLTSDSKGRCITKCLPKTKKKKICTANCFQFILCMIEIINHNLLFKLETSICSSFLALIGLFFKRNLFSSQKTRGNLQHGLSFLNKYKTVANKRCTIITGTLKLPQDKNFQIHQSFDHFSFSIK